MISFKICLISQILSYAVMKSLKKFGISFSLKAYLIVIIGMFARKF